MVKAGSEVICSPRTVSGGPEGDVDVAVVSSPCDNVIHSLVNTSGFSGGFLPGFNQVKPSSPSGHFVKADNTASRGHLFNYSMDHVTYVCRAGESLDVLRWYKENCGMQRFMVDAQEEEETGIEIRGEPGLRLMVGEWMSEWMCREEGVRWGGDEGGKTADMDFKLVLAEPLPNHPHSHVNKFIQEHGGPGIQHIGLLTSDIVATVRTLREGGARFRCPPPTYYELPNKWEEIAGVCGDPDIFKELGILIDQEQECTKGYTKDTNNINELGETKGIKGNGHTNEVEMLTYQNGNDEPGHVNGVNKAEYSDSSKVKEHILTNEIPGQTSNIQLPLKISETEVLGNQGPRLNLPIFPCPRYILQIFSYPLFRSETFFLECIQREGSRGFGAGNIREYSQILTFCVFCFFVPLFCLPVPISLKMQITQFEV